MTHTPSRACCTTPPRSHPRGSTTPALAPRPTRRHAARLLRAPVPAVVRGRGPGPQWHTPGEHHGGRAGDALVNGNTAAAAHLIERGAPVTRAAAACLDRWDDVARLGDAATTAQRQFASVLAALNGNAGALRALLDIGADVNRHSAELYVHASPLHHAVSSGSRWWRCRRWLTPVPISLRWTPPGAAHRSAGQSITSARRRSGTGQLRHDPRYTIA